MKKLLLISIIFATSASLIIPISSAEDLTIVTYYPSPQGVYKTVQLNPNDAAPTITCAANSLGTLFNNGSYTNAALGLDSPNTIYACNADGLGGYGWEALGMPGRTGAPGGIIVMWSGSVADIPSGWALCNGTHGTPDLRGRFIVGAGGSYSVNTGDSNPTHAHGMGNHTHRVSGQTSGWSGTRRNVAAGMSANLPEEDDSRWGVDITSDAASGNTDANAALPPYYALVYIMKL